GFHWRGNMHNFSSPDQPCAFYHKHIRQAIGERLKRRPAEVLFVAVCARRRASPARAEESQLRLLPPKAAGSPPLVRRRGVPGRAGRYLYRWPEGSLPGRLTVRRSAGGVSRGGTAVERPTEPATGLAVAPGPEGPGRQTAGVRAASAPG